MTQTIREHADKFAQDHGGVVTLRKTTSGLNNFSGILSFAFSCSDGSIVSMTWTKDTEGKYSGDPIFEIMAVGRRYSMMATNDYASYKVAQDMDRMASVSDIIEAAQIERREQGLDASFTAAAYNMLETGKITEQEWRAAFILGLHKS